MKQLPPGLLGSLRDLPGFNEELFVHAHSEPASVTSIRINPAKLFSMEERKQTGFRLDEHVPWSSFGFYLSSRPSFTFDPLFHAGCYYVQEASSMFLEQAIRQLTDLSTPLKVLDLCASPGGKSTHIQSLMGENSLLVSNEVIRSRAFVLRDNIIKWGCSNVAVTSNDPSAFGRMGAFFDLMVVDAPCSGSGLFRRDEDAMEEWSLNNVQLCYQRQQRILADALPALKENGILVFSTCSYSREEDEGIMDWLMEQEMEPLHLEIKDEWNIVRTASGKAEGYRFYPYNLKGEGFFLTCFRKTSGKGNRMRAARLEKAGVVERQAVLPWLAVKDHPVIRNGDDLVVIPPGFEEDLAFLSQALNLVYSGVVAGQVMKGKLVPAHSLALATIVSKDLPCLEVDYEDAIRYLQRQEMKLDAGEKGWQLVRYAEHNLGWVNVLSNRINNYYPKELRILKQSNDASYGK